MKAPLAPILLAASILTAAGVACNELSGVNDLVITSSSNAGVEAGEASGTFDGAGGDEGHVEAAGDADVRDGTAGDGDASDDIRIDERTPNDAPEEPADTMTDAATDVTTTFVDGGNADADATADVSDARADVTDATADVSDATGTAQDVTAEAPAIDSGCAVATPVCDAGCPTAHSDGFGHTFYDCAPWGTFNEVLALEACVAFTGSATQCANDPIGCANSDEVCTTGSSACVCWTYTGMHSGKVFASTTTACSCYVSGAPSWN
jgi:hypothetical protein